MDAREKVLYHQIHPLKLATDVGTAVIATVLLWRHELVAALLVGFVPSIAATALLVRFGNLEKLKESPLGRYVARSMTRAMEAVRFAGLAVSWTGAWWHRPAMVAAGAIVILTVWARGKFWPARA
jgi:hypothetical protein